MEPMLIDDAPVTNNVDLAGLTRTILIVERVAFTGCEERDEWGTCLLSRQMTRRMGIAAGVGAWAARSLFCTRNT